MKILIIHTNYRFKGGEDVVVDDETRLLKENYLTDTIFFKNRSGIIGFLQFLFSFWNPISASIVKKKILSFNPDLVHIHNLQYGAGPLIIRTIKKTGKPIVMTLHNYRLICPSGSLLFNNKLFLQSLDENFPWTAVRNGVYRNSIIQTFILACSIWFHKWIKTWNMVDLYICITKSAEEIFNRSRLNLDKSRVFIKPNFTPRPHVGEVNERMSHYLYVGRLSEEKGVKVLLEVFKSIVPSIKFVGDGPLKELVKEAGQNHTNIQYLGVLDNREVQYEMAKAKALIHPSICMETFGLTIIEAFANQCSVLASNLGAPGSIVTDGVNGFLFEAGNVEELKERIEVQEQLTPNKENHMRLNAYTTYCNYYTPDKQHDYFNAIFKKLKLPNHNN